MADDPTTGPAVTGPPAAPPPAAPAAWTPPTEDEWKRTQSALAKANTEAKERREKLAELQRKTEDADGKAARENAEAAEKKYKPVAVKAAARAALIEAGLTSASADRVSKVVRMLDLAELDIDTDGDVVGLQAQVDAVKKDYPELFTATVVKPPKLNTGNRPPAAGAPSRSADLLAAQVLGA